MTHLRFLWRLALLLGLVIWCVPPHLIARLRGPSPWPQRFLRRAAAFIGFDVKIEGAPRLHDVFYVSNHLSWIDIPALGGATGCAFISKDGIEKAPVIGWLAAQNHTVFVARERRGAVSGHIESVRAALAAHQPITLFAEGGVGDGKQLRAFKPPLFAVLLPPPRAIRIQPVVIDYGPAISLITWGTESGLANARRILGAPGRRTLTLHFLDPFDPADHPDRKLLATETHRRIEAALEALSRQHQLVAP
jgi:1-acyl-sn-glycerol-3-phosphate acyltransferase